MTTDIQLPFADVAFIFTKGLVTHETDPFHQGACLCLCKTDTSLCSVPALLPNLAARGPKPGPFVYSRSYTFNPFCLMPSSNQGIG